jgi:hypothetical protein
MSSSQHEVLCAWWCVQAARAAKGLLTVAAIDADAHQSLAAQFGIRGFPTIKFLYLDDTGKVGCFAACILQKKRGAFRVAGAHLQSIAKAES